MSNVIESWHRILRDRDFDALDTLLDEKVVFHSPVVHTPQEGKAITTLYLKAAFGVLGGSARPGEKERDEPNSGSGGKFRYVREVVGENDAVLEFTTGEWKTTFSSSRVSSASKSRSRRSRCGGIVPTRRDSRR